MLSPSNVVFIAAIAAAGVVIAVVVDVSVLSTAVMTANEAFDAEFGSYSARFQDFFSSRFRALRSGADGVSTFGTVPDVDMYQRVRRVVVHFCIVNGGTVVLHAAGT